MFLTIIHKMCNIYNTDTHSGVDSKDKLYPFCMLCSRVLFTFHIYLTTISYQVAADQITWVRKGHNLLFVNFTFLCYFFKIENL